MRVLFLDDDEEHHLLLREAGIRAWRHMFDSDLAPVDWIAVRP